MAAQARMQEPKLLQLAAINGFIGHPSPEREWSFERKIEEVAKAGFDGFTGRAPPITRRMVDDSGLLFWCTATSRPRVTSSPRSRRRKMPAHRR